MPQNIPNGTSTTLNGTASGGSGSYLYSWSPADSLIDATIEDPTTVNLYTSNIFTLLVTDSVTGCNDSDQVAVIVTGGPLSVSASATPSILCYGDSSELFALPSGGSGSYTYDWTSNPVGFTDTTSNPTVSPLDTTVYIVTVDDGFTTETDSVTVTVNPLLTANITPDSAVVCAGINLALNGNPGGGSGIYIDHLWTGDISPLSATTIEDPIFNTITAGVYNLTYTVTDDKGCAGTDNTIVTVNSATADAGPDAAICEGGSANLSAGGGILYNWSPSAGLSDTTISDPIASPSSTTIYTVTVTAANGCTDTDALTVTVNPLPVVDLGNDTSLCDDVTAFLLDAGAGYSSYLWNTLEITPSIIIDPSALGVGIHPYYVDVIDINTCQGSDTIIITVEICTGIDRSVTQSVIKIYPNPTKGVVNLEIENIGKESLMVEIINLNGQVIYHKNFKPVRFSKPNRFVEEIDLSSYPKGIYFVKVQSNELVKVEKMILN